MIYSEYKDAHGKEQTRIYTEWEQFHRDTFLPAIKIYTIIEFKMKRKRRQKKHA